MDLEGVLCTPDLRMRRLMPAATVDRQELVRYRWMLRIHKGYDETAFF